MTNRVLFKMKIYKIRICNNIICIKNDIILAMPIGTYNIQYDTHIPYICVNKTSVHIFPRFCKIMLLLYYLSSIGKKITWYYYFNVSRQL